MKCAWMVWILFSASGAWAQGQSATSGTVSIDADAKDSSRQPAADFSSDLKKLKEASANKDEQGVLQAANRILGVDSKNLQALNSLAVHYYNQGRMGLSKILLLRALNDHPDVPALYNNLAVLYLIEGRQSQAIGSFRKSIELQAGYPYAAANLSSIYLEYKDYKRAAQDLAAAFDATKADLRRGAGLPMDIASNYAVALSGSGDLERAKEVFQKIVKVDDQNPSTLYNYAVLLVARMKNKKEGEKIIARLKFLADSSLLKKIEELEKMLSGT